MEKEAIKEFTDFYCPSSDREGCYKYPQDPYREIHPRANPYPFQGFGGRPSTMMDDTHARYDG